MKPAVPIVPVRGRLLRARAVGEYLGVSERKARTLIAKGELVAVRSSSGRLEGVYERDCDAWIEEHRRAAVPPVPRPPQFSGDARLAHLLRPEDRVF